jgi:peptide chain release factor 1
MNELQREIAKVNSQIAENKALLETEATPTMQNLIKEELRQLQDQLKELEKANAVMQGNYEELANDEMVEGNGINPNVAIVEVRAGTGGDEAGLFAADLLRMYMRYGETHDWKTKEIFSSENVSGGYKTVAMEIKGKSVYALLKNESGVHRVQRIPTTESAGRIHTSTATVAVLPKIKKTTIEIKPEDLQWEFFRAGGHGGQNVNKVSTAVRLIHTPTGCVVECQEERTQGRNRDKARELLDSRLFTMMQEQQVQNISDLRSSQVGTGDRSEKIRTYNYPQNRITDHRLKKSWHSLSAIMEGDLDGVFGETQTLED